MTRGNTNAAVRESTRRLMDDMMLSLKLGGEPVAWITQGELNRKITVKKNDYHRGRRGQPHYQPKPPSAPAGQSKGRHNASFTTLTAGRWSTL